MDGEFPHPRPEAARDFARRISDLLDRYVSARRRCDSTHGNDQGLIAAWDSCGHSDTELIKAGVAGRAGVKNIGSSQGHAAENNRYVGRDVCGDIRNLTRSKRGICWPEPGGE